MESEQVLTLLPKKKSGLERLIFSRAVILCLLMALQLLLLFSVFHWFREHYPIFTIFQTLFSIGMLLYLFNCGMDATAKLTWLWLIMLMPIPATFFLWITRRDIGQRTAKERLQQLLSESAELITQAPEVITDEELVSSGTDDLVRYLNRSGTFPIYADTEVTYFPSGEAKLEALLRELRQAEHFIYLEYFIVEEGFMWGSILKLLAEKAAAGVDVRVMYDGMCEVKLLPHDYPKRLAELGIRCKPFIPLTPFFSTCYNYRDHRKILVIDGKTAFNGGVNLADEYINRKPRFGRWKDTAVMLKGRAAESFTLMFLQLWNATEPTPDWEAVKAPAAPGSGSGFVLPYGDSPMDGMRVGELVYMDILYRAKSYVHIMTPYLILDNELETALCYAAERGVDVKIILPGIPDKKSAYALAKTHYPALLRAGVKLYTYTPGFVHAKVFVSDDEKGVVGTINLDYRSLYHHFECATYLYRTPCIADMEADFNETLAQCTEITPETVKAESVAYKLTGALLKIIAPLM